MKEYTKPIISMVSLTSTSPIAADTECNEKLVGRVENLEKPTTWLYTYNFGSI